MPLLNIAFLVNEPIATITAYRKFFAIFLGIFCEFCSVYKSILNECPAVLNEELESTNHFTTIPYSVYPCLPISTPNTDKSQSTKRFMPPS